MRRIALVLAMIGLLVPAAIAASPPAAAAVTMSGRIERVAVDFSGGPYLDIYGWSKDPRDVYTNNNLVKVTVTGPDGRAVATAFSQPLLSTQAFPNGVDDHPDKDPRFGNTVHHGFWTRADVSKAGVYTVCAQAAPGYPTPSAGSWTSLGCAKVTVPVRKVTGAITSIGGHAGQAGLYIDGWAADSWNDTPLQADFTVAYTGPAGVPAWDMPPQALTGGVSVQDPPKNLVSQHPGVVGIRSVNRIIDPAPPGTYTVCALFADSAGAVKSTKSCKTTTVVSAYPTTSLSVSPSGTVAVGSTIRSQPATWAPSGAQIKDRLIIGTDFDGVDLDQAALAEGAPGTAFTVPPTAAGHTVCLVETASVSGGVTAGQSACADAVVDGVQLNRINGADRYATAAAISKKAFPGVGPSTVYLASGATFADALSVGPVVAKTRSALLLTRANVLPPATRTEIVRLHPSRIVVVGGAGAVTDAVLAQLRTIVPTVTRIGGADRYATSRAVITAAYPAGSSSRVLVATGRDFPDAEAAVPAAAALGAPIMLVDGGASRADAATVAALKRLGAKRVTVLGGTGVINARMAGTFGTEISVDRVAGADRFATATAIAKLASPGRSAHAYLASSSDFPDALAAATLVGVAPGPIYLGIPRCVQPGTIGDIVRVGATEVTQLGVLDHPYLFSCI
ncbi:MAG: cell wall-binding repeat-containing protein [Microbacterium sp.]|jgi:putative cell wall-binding protein|nr:cell wall-binding repeat-containing protein [Microbacterium sp.]